MFGGGQCISCSSVAASDGCCRRRWQQLVPVTVPEMVAVGEFEDELGKLFVNAEMMEPESFVRNS